jgi:membrane protein DedA with SNARE-associated domain
VRNLLERHTDLAIFLILFMEDLGVPMPIPADFLVMYAGYRLRDEAVNPFYIIGLAMLAVNLAATILFTVARVGGRPLIDRYGRYLHLNARRLERAEAWLERYGVVAIIIGRALPGVRLATVIACGLFKVPYRVFLPAQFVGVAIYLTCFLWLGYVLGPQAVERIHVPASSLRLALLIAGVVLLPLGLRLINQRTRRDDTAVIQGRLRLPKLLGAALLAGFAGMIQLSAIWAITAALTKIMRHEQVQHAALTLARWTNIDHSPQAVAIAYTLNYLATLVVCLLVAVLFFQILMPRFGIGPRELGKQTIALLICMLLLAAVVISAGMVLQNARWPGSAMWWFTHSGAEVLAVIGIGLLGYAYVAVETRRLAVDRFSTDPRVAPSVVEALVKEDSPMTPAAAESEPAT